MKMHMIKIWWFLSEIAKQHYFYIYIYDMILKRIVFSRDILKPFISIVNFTRS